jgi:hypothetical protein
MGKKKSEERGLSLRCEGLVLSINSVDIYVPPDPQQYYGTAGKSNEMSFESLSPERFSDAACFRLPLAIYLKV